jgi:hypothetical protein
MNETAFYIILGLMGGVLLYSLIQGFILKKKLTEALIAKGLNEIEKAKLEAMLDASSMSPDELKCRILELLAELRRGKQTN